MKFFHPQLLAALLQLAPLARVFQTSPRLAANPSIAILRWIFGASAVVGTMHALSGASGISPTAITATNGVRSSTTFVVSDTSHGIAPSYSSNSPLPPGMTLSTRGILFGTPTQSGVFPLTITGWKNSDLTGNSATKSAKITVLGTQPPIIFTQPTSLTVQLGQPATFTVGFTGDQPLTLRWFKEDIEVSSATNATLTLPNVKATSAGRYRVRLVNSLATVFSDFVTLTVSSPDPAPSITTQPVSQMVHEGESVHFTVAASGAHLKFLWTFKGFPISGTNATLSLAQVTPFNAGSYLAEISNATGTTQSSIVTLDVLPPLRFDPLIRTGSTLQLPFIGAENRPYIVESAVDIRSPFSLIAEVIGHTNGSSTSISTSVEQFRIYRVRSAN
ncbi:MAG: hypothetical protein EXS25_05690 [Pedosphaera sp.]|nr:hypothetical protein [Pedosphaera sp.]